MIPPRTILAAVDFSDCSRLALIVAARLAAQTDGRLHVLHVEEPLLHAAATHYGIDLATQTREELERFVASAWPTSERRPSLHVRAGATADSIVAAAAAEAADVIVIGSRGMSGAGLERLIFGSTAERVLRRAERPVLVVPPEWSPPRPTATDLSGTGPVIVGSDFSKASEAALEAGLSLAALFGTGLEIMHVVPVVPVLQRWQEQADAEGATQASSARQELELLVERLRTTVPTTVRVEAGHAAKHLAEAAAANSTRHPFLVLGHTASGAHGGSPGTRPTACCRWPRRRCWSIGTPASSDAGPTVGIGALGFLRCLPSP